MTSSAWTVADEKPIVFRRLALESFRGFNDRQDFDLAANVVVLRGPNGLGKTASSTPFSGCWSGTLPG